VRASKGNYLSIGPHRGRCLLGHIRTRWFQATIPGNPYWKNQNCLMLARTKGCDKTSRSGLIYKLEDVGSLRWAPRKCQLLATLCVIMSLALFALGSTNPTGRFCLRTLCFGRHLGNHRARLRYGCHIPCCHRWCNV
jgi:hypothetical protein